LVHAQGKKDTTALPDRVLLDKIKAKIASGTFEIDYQQISQAILHDSLAQIGAKSGK
jgi:anti-sigma28 factor (negative regulator of flagellin synthesis)